MCAGMHRPVITTMAGSDGCDLLSYRWHTFSILQSAGRHGFRCVGHVEPTSWTHSTMTGTGRQNPGDWLIQRVVHVETTVLMAIPLLTRIQSPSPPSRLVAHMGATDLREGRPLNVNRRIGKENKVRKRVSSCSVLCPKTAVGTGAVCARCRGATKLAFL